jgi:small-conductance mechanosensitive channel
MIFQLNILGGIAHLIVGVGVIFLIWFGQSILGRLVKRRLSKQKDAINGIVWIIRILSAFFILFFFLYYFGIINDATSLSLISIASTAIGFSLTIAISNFFSGMYLIVSRPYQVGDFLQMSINNVEGFVREIGLNYTKIRDAKTGMTTLIPNKLAMNENLLVYKVPRQYKDGEKKVISASKRKGLKSVLVEEVDHVFRYQFFIEENLSTPSEKVEATLKGVADKWTPIFGYIPRFFITALSSNVTVRVVITADTIATIQSDIDKFLEDIWFGLNLK